ncbi:hypothetical protein EDD16DRAFT_1573111 [Pisolithus croceorrhizus]|nr:hypothetical protein F5141DRAFT_1143390 [Pisolithus sp. B1]KAI6122250.1 hypothetical protein EDD16DRAFT_1573111 [Pisolithus croceorrhizus]
MTNREQVVLTLLSMIIGKSVGRDNLTILSENRQHTRRKFCKSVKLCPVHTVSHDEWCGDSDGDYQYRWCNYILSQV